MARKLRVEFAGAIYRVINRGDRRQEIFCDDRDRSRFLETLAEGCAKTGWQVRAFCLMPNHFHSMTLPWIAARWQMGTRTHLAHLLYWEGRENGKGQHDTML